MNVDYFSEDSPHSYHKHFMLQISLSAWPSLYPANFGTPCFYFSPSSIHFCILFETSFLLHGLLRNVLSTSQVFGCVPFVFTLLIPKVNQLWSENTLYVIPFLQTC